MSKTYVITSAVSNCILNKKLFTTILSYCKHNNAELLVVPVKYDLDRTGDYLWHDDLHTFFVTSNITLCNKIKLLAAISTSPSIDNPFAGYEVLCKGDSIIIPHPQIRMKTVPMSHVDPCTIMHTTGAVTDARYTSTKQGTKAYTNHSLAALVVEEDASINGFHIRVLNSGPEGSFYDLDKFYDGETVTTGNTIDALVLGDEHVIHVDPQVSAATLTAKTSLAKVLKPKFIVRHDSLDFFSGSHHHEGNPFIQYAKHMSGNNDVRAELKLTMDYILKTTPKFSKSIVISSNHNEHLYRWLTECKPNREPWNMLLYHELMYLMLKETKMGTSSVDHPNPLELWTRHNYVTDKIQFIGGYESFKVDGVELSFHGDKGVNGSRASAVQFSKIGTKTIVGHSHSSSIIGGCYQVGTSSYLKLDYNTGPSSWIHSACLIHQNGRRQMVFIIKGKYRR